MCACFFSHLLSVYIGRVHVLISGCTVLWEVHPASAQNKSLISDTERLCEKSHMLVGAKVCDLTEDLLWFVCGVMWEF